MGRNDCIFDLKFIYDVGKLILRQAQDESREEE